MQPERTGQPVRREAAYCYRKYPTPGKIGIIVRKQDEKDQRISRIYLTEEGKAIINEGMRMAKEGEKQVLNGFSESELCLMKRFCIQIKENIAAMPAPEFSPEEMCMGHFCHNKK